MLQVVRLIVFLTLVRIVIVRADGQVVESQSGSDTLVREIITSVSTPDLETVKNVMGAFESECDGKWFCRLDIAAHRHNLRLGNFSDVPLDDVRLQTVDVQRSNRFLVERVKFAGWEWVRSSMFHGDFTKSDTQSDVIDHGGFKGRITYVNVVEKNVVQVFIQSSGPSNMKAVVGLFRYLKELKGDRRVNLAILVRQDGWFPHIKGFPLFYQFVNVEDPSIARDFERVDEFRCLEGQAVECSLRKW